MALSLHLFTLKGGLPRRPHKCFPKAWCTAGSLTPATFPTLTCTALTHRGTGTGHSPLETVSYVRGGVCRRLGMDTLSYNVQKAKTTSRAKRLAPPWGLGAHTPSSSPRTGQHQGRPPPAGSQTAPRSPQAHLGKAQSHRRSHPNSQSTLRPPLPCWQTSSKKPPRGPRGGQGQAGLSFQAVNSRDP